MTELKEDFSMKLSAFLPALGFLVVGLGAMPNQASAAINCDSCRAVYYACMGGNEDNDASACVKKMIAYNRQCGSCPLLPSEIGAIPAKDHKDPARAFDKVTLHVAQREVASLTIQ